MKQVFLSILLMLMPIVASADYSGTCGSGATYSFNESTQTLSISGSGAMRDYSNIDEFAPWYDYRDKILIIKIGEGITSIGMHAFINCKNLISVNISNTVSFIGFESFYGCSKLSSIDLPNSIVDIDENAFASCGLTSIVIPSNVTSIKTNTFSCCTYLNSVTIPYGVTSIGERAFDSCENLASINIPNSVLYIGEYAFNYCWKMTSLEIPSSVKSIGKYAFKNCFGLTSMTIPSSIVSIEEGTFDNCQGLTFVDIPNSVKIIGAYAFQYSGLTSVTIPESVISIDKYAFNNCSALISAEIPSSVSSIGESTFRDCESLTTIIIPNSVTAISSAAFMGCNKLSVVYCYAEIVPATEPDIFKNSSIENATLYVPSAGLEQYKAKAPWSSFKEILPYDAPVYDQQCEKPAIIIANGLIEFTCETEDVVFHYDISSSVQGEGTGIKLPETFKITVYASKDGYNDSEVETTEISAPAAGDLNRDGVVDAADVVMLVNSIMDK